MISRNIKSLRKTLQNSTIFQEYYNLKEQINRSEELKKIKKKLNELKQLLTKNVNNRELHSLYSKEYESVLNEYNNHPLIQNYEYIKEEVKNELNFIKEQISQ